MRRYIGPDYYQSTSLDALRRPCVDDPQLKLWLKFTEEIAELGGHIVTTHDDFTVVVSDANASAARALTMAYLMARGTTMLHEPDRRG